MAGQITPVLTQVAAGLLQGTALAIAPQLTAALTAFRNDQTLFSGKIRTVLALEDIETTAPGITAALYALPIFITAQDNNNDLAAAIESRANEILPAGAIGIQEFSTTLGQATAFISTSFQWKGAMAELGPKSFDDFGLGVNNFSDMVSGGATKIFSAPGGKTDIKSVASSFNNIGQLYNTLNMSTLGSPANLIKQLDSLGLGNVGQLNEKLEVVGASDTDSASPVVLKQVLSTLSSADVNKIIKTTGAKVANSAQLTSAADLLDAKKILPIDLANSMPAGSFAGLGNAMVNMGGKFDTAAAADDYLKKIEVPNFPKLNTVTAPVPPTVAQQLTANLGTGTGPFNTPTLLEMIGTCAGYKHIEAFEFSVHAQQQILDSEYGIAFNEAIANLQSAIAGGTDSFGMPLDINSAVQEVVAVVTDINNSGNLALIELIQQANEKMTASKNQLALETSNLLSSKIGKNKSSPNTKYASYDIAVGITPTALSDQSLLNFSTQFHTFGIDQQNVGYNNLFVKLATNDQYGEAVQAALIEGRALANQAAVGIRTAVRADPSAYLKTMQSSSGTSDDSDWYRG